MPTYLRSIDYKGISYLLQYIEAYRFEGDLYIILEYKPICLIQVVVAPVHLRKIRRAAIVGEVGLPLSDQPSGLTSVGVERYQVPGFQEDSSRQQSPVEVSN